MNRKLANSKVVFQSIKSQLTLQDPDEVQAVALAIMGKYFGLSLTDILSGKGVDDLDFSAITGRVNGHEPLQYILGEADFFGRTFEVNPNVLIPRPETELLIRGVLKHNLYSPRILDIGTGSGCIAITLNLEIPQSKVTAIDVSAQALAVAKRNSEVLKSQVKFIQLDFFRESSLGEFDMIVSNPPYVTMSEQKSMNKNVVDFEPHEALFVPNEDPLMFYKAIASKSKTMIAARGKIFVEINEQFGKETKDLFEKAGFNSVQIIKDLDGKDRVISAEKSY